MDGDEADHHMQKLYKYMYVVVLLTSLLVQWSGVYVVRRTSRSWVRSPLLKPRAKGREFNSHTWHILKVVSSNLILRPERIRPSNAGHTPGRGNYPEMGPLDVKPVAWAFLGTGRPLENDLC